MPAVRLEEEEGVGVGRGRKAFLFRLHYLKGKRRAVSGTGGNSGCLLYTSFPAPEARRIAKRLEIHYTPKHGSWLDIAEIELNVMARQCLSRRIKEIILLRQELAAWESDRNKHTSYIQWQFTTDNARIKLI